MNKLRTMSVSENSIATINSSVPLTNVHFTKTQETIETTGLKAAKTRKKKVTFSSQEDSFILAGIRKYGVGKWTAILNDNEYPFHPSRKTSTLQVRAKSKGYI